MYSITEFYFELDAHEKTILHLIYLEVKYSSSHIIFCMFDTLFTNTKTILVYFEPPYWISDFKATNISQDDFHEVEYQLSSFLGFCVFVLHLFAFRKCLSQILDSIFVLRRTAMEKLMLPDGLL